MADYSIFLIRSTDHDEILWWSNKQGWGDLGNATAFLAYETHVLRLPIGGTWVKFTGETNG